MYKLLYFTDPHYTRQSPEGRTNSFGLQVRKKLAEVVSLANKHDVNAVLCGGDIFHLKGDATMGELREITEIISRFNAHVYGVLGNHDIAGYERSSKENRAVGVMEEAGLITWLGEQPDGEHKIVTLGDDDIQICGASYCKDYERPENYGVGTKTDKILIWLSHGMLTTDKKLPYDFSYAPKIAEDTGADILLNGHFHTKQFEIKQGRTIVINPGSIGRVARDDEHNPCVVMIVIDEKKQKWGHKMIPLKRALPWDQVFLEEDESVKSTDEEVRQFAEELVKDSQDLRQEDLQAVVDKACTERSEGVRDETCRRLGL